MPTNCPQWHSKKIYLINKWKHKKTNQQPRPKSINFSYFSFICSEKKLLLIKIKVSNYQGFLENTLK